MSIFKNADCFSELTLLPEASVDLIVTDPPYGTASRHAWDADLNSELFWQELHRVAKDNAPILLFASEPFRTLMIQSNFSNFRYDLIWSKNKFTGFFNAKKQPLRAHESILVFYRKPPVYHPQMSQGHRPTNATIRKGVSKMYGTSGVQRVEGGKTERYPTSILQFPVVNNDDPARIHPSQKPLELLQYLVRTYSNPGAVVLDCFAGSGAVLRAAQLEGREYIGFEQDSEFFNKAAMWLESPPS